MADCSLSNVAKICQKTCGSCWSFILQLALWIYIGPNADRQNVQRNIGAHFFEYLLLNYLSYLFINILYNRLNCDDGEINQRNVFLSFLANHDFCCQKILLIVF